MKNITKLDESFYEVRFTYTDSRTGKRVDVRRRFEGSLKQAAAFRDQLKRDAERGTLDRPYGEDPTVSDFFDDFMKARRSPGRWEASYSTVKNSRGKLERHILPVMGDWIVERIEIADFVEATETLSERTKQDGTAYSPATVNSWIRDGKVFLKYAFLQVGRATAPVDDWPKVSEASVTKRGRALTRSELETLRDAFKERWPHWHPLVTVLAFTGQRWGTVTALKWDHIDFDRGIIRFVESHYQGRVRSGSKTGDIVVLPMSKPLRRALVDQRDQVTGSLVFPCINDHEKYLNSSNLLPAFEEACDIAGIERVTPHDLRRSFVSIAMDSGVEPERIKAITGHCQAMIEHYYHASRAGMTEVLSSVSG